MTATLQTQETFRITATAVSPAADLAIGSVASLLGIEPRRAAERLASVPTVLAREVPGPRARQISAMLMLLGLRVRLDPDFSTPLGGVRRMDQALQPMAGADCGALALRLASLPGLLPDLSERLEQAGGLILRGRTNAERYALRKVLGRQKELRVLESDPETALFDLFARRSPRLLDLVSRLGLAPCSFTGAVAKGLNLATGQVLLQAAGPDALLLDQAFQRFDLVLWTVPGPRQAELAEFLAMRLGRAGDPGGDCQRLPLRLDRDLSRSAACQFVADYTAMGMEVSARLRGTLPPGPQQNC